MKSKKGVEKKYYRCNQCFYKKKVGFRGTVGAIIKERGKDMKRKYLLITFTTIIIFLILTGCSSVVKEKDIQRDLETYSKMEFLEKEESIDKIVIEKRDTNKKDDTVWCTVITKNPEIAYEKNVVLFYHKYDKDGWVLDEISLDDSSEWKVTPLKGIDKKDIPLTLEGKSVMIDGESWNILENEVTEILIDKQETDLKSKTDKVWMTITLKGEVEKIKGKVVASYKFDDTWNLDEILETGDFVAELIPEKALNVTEDKLIEQLTKEKIVLGSDSRFSQEIAVMEDEVSDFKIESHEAKVKGTEQTFYCSCILNKSNVVFALKISIPYFYEGEWLAQSMTVTPEIKTFDILGEWKGEYLAPGIPGSAVLNITEVDGNEITATYQYIPELINNLIEGGAYNVSGTIDIKTLNMRLVAGEWIEQPKHDALVRQDIVAVINVDNAMIEGNAQEGYVFRVTR